MPSTLYPYNRMNPHLLKFLTHPLRHRLLRCIIGCMAVSTAGLDAQTVPDSLWIKESAVLQWDFENNLNGWTAASSMVANLRAERGCLRGDSLGNDPYISNPAQNLQLSGSAGVAIRVWFSEASTLQLYWSNEDGGFASTRFVKREIPAQQWTTVKFNLSAHAQWAGKTIQRLRIDPGTTALSYAIDYLAILDRIDTRDQSMVTQTYDFATDSQGWSVSSAHVTGYRWEDGKMKGSTTGVDPYVVGPLLSYSGQGGVALQIKSSHNGRVGIYWETTEGEFSEEQSVFLPVTNKGWQILWFDLRGVSTWAGKTITRLRVNTGEVSGQDFEIDSIVLLKPEAFDDLDKDKLIAFVEKLHCADVAAPSSVRGRVAMETWAPMIHYSTRSLVMDSDFYEPATSFSFLPDSTTGLQPGTYFASRIRGYIVAPVSGEYRFWISGRNGVELNLSTDSSQYKKRRVAEINPDLGDVHGIPYGSTNLWDQSAAQMSPLIQLEQGQSYYFEVLQANGHGGNAQVSLAWAPPGGSRVRVPATSLRSYTRDAADGDDDCLPDDWESQHGLNVQDNGRIDIDREGELGDYDSDGLSNRDEYLLGTDPTNSDTDGDGESDGNEVNGLDTDALLANAITDTLLGEIALGGFTSSSVPWTMTPGGLVAEGYRGSATWDFSVPVAGNWLLRLELELMGSTYANEDVPVVIRVDGKTVLRRKVRFGTGKFGVLQALTPWITAGGHQVEILIDNIIARRTVRLVSLKVFSPANPNGILSAGNSVVPHATATRTSPFFIEGMARDAGAVRINGAPATLGTGNGHWFSNISLADENGAQTYTVAFEQAWETAGSITWQATNVMDGEALVIRQGETLRVGAWGADPEMPSSLTVSSGGTTSLTGAETTTLTFSTAGTFTVTGILQSGASATLQVTVVAPPTFTPGEIDTLDSAKRVITVATAPQVAFDVPADQCRLGVTSSGSNSNLEIYPASGSEFSIAGRLFPGGPILGIQRVNVITISDALQNDLTSLSVSNFPGYMVLNTPMTVLNLPQGARLDVSILRAGVLFLDGTTLKSLTAGDIQNGSVLLSFLFPLGQSGGYCHQVRVYDRNGVYLGTR